jgi:predicted RNA polymerase sigma factor
VLLLDQNRALWDPLLIQRGFPALARAWALGTPPGVYVLQAEIAACHARARTASDTEWTRIAALYDTLAGVAPSPVIEINRAVAHAMAFGPAAGLSIVDAVATEPALAKYHLLPSVRADLLARLGRLDEAGAEAERAAALAKNDRERAMLRARAAMWAKGER